MKRVEQAEQLDKAIAGKKAVVLFHATWCPFCRAFWPVFERATAGKKLAAIEAVIDDEDNELWAKYDLEVVPAVLFFEGGKVVRRLDGQPGVGLTEADLSEALQKV
jgi:thiol-disulfide isomerase/thioredoxin